MGAIKNFLLRHALKAKMKDMPEGQREQMLALMEKHPDFFKKIGEEIKRRTKAGQSEMAATMVVMRENQAELQRLTRQ